MWDKLYPCASANPQSKVKKKKKTWAGPWNFCLSNRPYAVTFWLKLHEVLEAATGCGNCANCKNSKHTEFPVTDALGNVFALLVLSKERRKLSLNLWRMFSNSLMFYEGILFLRSFFFVSLSWWHDQKCRQASDIMWKTTDQKRSSYLGIDFRIRPLYFGAGEPLISRIFPSFIQHHNDPVLKLRSTWEVSIHQLTSHIQQTILDIHGTTWSDVWYNAKEKKKSFR